MEKRFKPTRKKLEKALCDGNLLKSSFLSQIICIIIGLGVPLFFIRFYWVENRILLECIGSFREAEEILAFEKSAFSFVWQSYICLLPVVAGVIISELAQIGFIFKLNLSAPKISRLEPVAGLNKIFSNLQQAFFNFLRLAIVISFFLLYLKNNLPGLVFSFWAEESGRYRNFYALLSNAFLIIVFILLIFSALDYYLKHKKWFRQVGMSEQDIKDEHKESEGDPSLKHLRNARHAELLRQDLIARVRKSKVIIVNKS